MRKLIEHKEIVSICERLGKDITDKFQGKEPMIACVLKGASPFHSELIKHINLDCTLDYIQVSSYKGTTTTGNITMKKDLEYDIHGKDVIIVEDIVDTGITLTKLNELLKTRNPNSITYVTLLDKPSKRQVHFVPDYVGKTIEDLFVIGFGLDLDEKYRNLKDIYVYNED